MIHGVTASLYPPDYETVPTVADLVKRGLAREEVTKHFGRDGKAKSETRFRVSAEGQQLIYDAMERNAARSRAWDTRRASAAVDADQV